MAKQKEHSGVILLWIFFLIGVFLTWAIFSEPHENNYQSYFDDWFLDKPIIGNALGYILLPIAFVGTIIGGLLLGYWYLDSLLNLSGGKGR